MILIYEIYFDFYIGRQKWDLKHNCDDKNTNYTNEVYYEKLRFKDKSQHRKLVKHIVNTGNKAFFFLFLIKFASNKNMRKDVSFFVVTHNPQND